LYAQLGVKEYFLFDPIHEYLDPPLQGYRLVRGQYVQMTADAQGALLSKVLRLRLQADGGQVAFYRLDTGERLLTAAEELEALEAKTEALRAVEAEVARLREELRRRSSM
jgi:hypothetical protein